MKAEYNVLNSELLYTIIIHFIINRLLATYFKNHTIYGKSFGSHNSKYWCFLQSMVIQSCIFIPSGLLIGSHYNFQSKKIFNSSVENDYSPYSYILSYQEFDSTFANASGSACRARFRMFPRGTSLSTSSFFTSP